MKITKKVKYALTALSYMSNQEDKVNAQDISKKFALSKGFMGEVMRELKVANLVNSKKGPGGGYTLNQPLKEIKLNEVFKAMGAPIEKDLQKDTSDICLKIDEDLQLNLYNFGEQTLDRFNG